MFSDFTYRAINAKKISIIVWVLMLFVGNVYGQSVANYAVTRSTGISYTSIMSTGTACASWRNSSSLIEDDNRSFQQPIGFDFWYNGTRYTQFSVSTNGYIDFSTSSNDGGPTTASYGYDNTKFSAQSGTLLALAPMYDDMTTQGATDPLGLSIKYQVDGTAPNRVLTVEWRDMAIYQNTNPSLNFQVKIYETTGIIEFLYGTMNNGGVSFSYSTGINASSISASPTTAQLKTLQTANSTTFSNTPKNNLSTMPTSNSKYTFTPPTPLNPSTSLTFTNVLATSMTLNFANWASNELGYVIYNSTDGTTYNFVSQTAANATSAAVTGLISGTTYYWRVYAVTEGRLSNAMSATQATAAGGTYTSNVTTGNWGTSTSWTPNGIPTLGDNVIIRDGHTITVNTNANCKNLTVGQTVGGANLVIGDNSTVRTLVIKGDISVSTASNLRVNTASDATHLMTVTGNISNSGTIDFQPDANSFCNVTFDKVGTQTISGSGATHRYNRITVNKGTSNSNTLDISSTTFTAASGFLTLTNGAIKFSAPATQSHTLFTAASTTIGTTTAIWNASSTVTLNINGTIQLDGTILNSTGTMNIGNSTNHNLIYNGGTLTISGGDVKVAGRYDRLNTTSLSKLYLNGGRFTAPYVSSTSTTRAPVHIDVPGSILSWNGGDLIIQQEGGTGAQDFGFTCTDITNYTITSGSLRIGNASTPASQIIGINTTLPLSGLIVNSSNATSSLTTNNLTVNGNITLTAGTLNINGLNLTVSGNVTGTGILSATTGTVTYSGASQTVFGTTYNNITFSGSGSKTLGSNLVVTGNITIGNGTTFNTSTSNYSVTIGGNWINNGTFTGNNSTVTFNKAGAQTIGGTATTRFTNLTTSVTSSTSLLVNTELSGTLTLGANTSFITTGYNFTMISTGGSSTQTARIAAVPSTATFTGNATVQRFIPGVIGLGDWEYISCPVRTQTVASLQDDFPVTGEFTGFTPNQPSNNASMYRYNEGKGTTFDNGWEKFPDIALGSPNNANTASLEIGRGYSTWVRASFVNAVIDFTGVPVIANTSSVSFPLTYNSNGDASANGWNLVGNPFPSQIDWASASGWSLTNVDPSAYFRTANNVFTFWNRTLGIGTNPDQGRIALGQAFYVRTTSASPVLTANENVKTSGSTLYLRASETKNYQYLQVKVSNKEGMSDEAILVRKEDATVQIDQEYDTYKISNPSLNLSFVVGSDRLALNALPSYFEKNDTVWLDLSAYTPGEYMLDFSNMESFDYTNDMQLVDVYTKQVISLNEASSYSFQVTSDIASEGKRFALVFKPFSPLAVEQVAVTQNEQIHVYPNPTTDKLYVEIVDKSLNMDLMFLLDVSGKRINLETAKNNQGVILNVSSLDAGVYTLVIGGKAYRFTKE